MLSFILSVTIIFAQEHRVAVRADRISNPEAVAYALSWSFEPTPVLVTKDNPRKVKRIMLNKYCTRIVVRKSVKGVELNANKYTYLQLNQFYQAGMAGRRVILTGVQKASKVSTLTRMIKAQMRFESEDGGVVDLSGFQRSCIKVH